MTASLLLRTVIQRVSSADVKIEGVSQGVMDKGLLVLFAVGVSSFVSGEALYQQDAQVIVKSLLPRLEKLCEKILALRIFNDEQGKMNLSVKDVEGGLYVVSQFTLFADCSKGTRPGFTQSAKPVFAQPIYDHFVRLFKDKHPQLNVLTGKFAHEMKVSLCNDGPVTLIVDA